MSVGRHLRAGIEAGLHSGVLAGLVASWVALYGTGVLLPLATPSWAVACYLMASLALLGAAAGALAGVASGIVLPRSSQPRLLHHVLAATGWFLAPVAFYTNVRWLPAWRSPVSLAVNLALALGGLALALILARMMARRLDAGEPGSAWRVLGATVLMVVGLAGSSSPWLRGMGTQGHEAEAEPAGVAAPETERPNIILVSIDTLRATHLGAYGYRRATSPRIDALAARGVLFETCFSPAPNTHPALAALMTASTLVDYDHLTLVDFLPAERFTLAEALSGAGYRTLGVVANAYLRKIVGFHQGFTSYDEESALLERPAGVTRTALEAVDADQGPGPLFLWVHYLDPHHPYAPVEPHAGRFDPDGLARARVRAASEARQSWEDMLRQAEEGGELGAFVDLYDAELAEVDAAVGVLLDGLEARGLLEGAVLVVTADHGEEFGEHGGTLHGHTLYNELTRVPLVLVAPGLEPGRRVEQTVRLMDLAPTLLALVGVPRPASWQGVDMLGDPEEAPRPVLVEKLHATEGAAPPLVALVEGDLKLITASWRPYLFGFEPVRTFTALGQLVLWIASEPARLYRLQPDGGEEPLGREADAERRRLTRHLSQLYRTGAATARSRPSTELDPETREMLRGLGYLDE